MVNSRDFDPASLSPHDKALWDVLALNVHVRVGSGCTPKQVGDKKPRVLFKPEKNTVIGELGTVTVYQTWEDLRDAVDHFTQKKVNYDRLQVDNNSSAPNLQDCRSVAQQQEC